MSGQKIINGLQEALDGRGAKVTVVNVDVTSIPDEHLLGRAVRNARSRDCRKGEKHPRWVAVSDAFSLGSTFSMQLCRRYGLNPDEPVKR